MSGSQFLICENTADFFKIDKEQEGFQKQRLGLLS